jgi:transcriptional regulator with XRE-family HTH domain
MRMGRDRQPALRVVALMLNVRRARQWSQEQLAQHLGISVVTVSRWERKIGSVPQATVDRLTQCLNGKGHGRTA